MLSLIALVGVAVGFLAALALLFLPTIVANLRHHPNTLAIFLVNLFLGWTFIGWVVALVWACTRPAIAVYPAPAFPPAGSPPSMYPPQPSAVPAQGAAMLPPSVPLSGPYPGER